MTVAKAELEELVVPDQAALAAWLATHHDTSPGVWLVLTRKGGTVTTLTWQQAVDEGLCVGWIDGQKRPESAAAWLQRFLPRSRTSIRRGSRRR